MRLSPEQLDTLTELINIGMGHAASTLNQMVGAHVILRAPSIKILEPEELGDYFAREEHFSLVRMNFEGAFSGSALLVFPLESASRVVDVLMGQNPETPDLDMMRVGALTEVGNIVLNGVVGNLSNIMKQPVRYAIPSYLESNPQTVLFNETRLEPVLIMAHTRMKIEEFRIEGQVILIFQMKILDNLLAILDNLNASFSPMPSNV